MSEILHLDTLAIVPARYQLFTQIKDEIWTEVGSMSMNLHLSLKRNRPVVVGYSELLVTLFKEKVDCVPHYGNIMGGFKCNWREQEFFDEDSLGRDISVEQLKKGDFALILVDFTWMTSWRFRIYPYLWGDQVEKAKGKA